MTGPEKLTERRQSAMVLPESGDRFDQELAGWFALHGGHWRGTAAELSAAVKIRAGVGNDFWPQSPRALYAQIESRCLQLRSLGVDVRLHPGYPRMLSLRSCEQTAKKPPLGTAGINRTFNPTINLPRLADEQRVNLADARQIGAAATKSFSQNIAIGKSDLAEPFVNGRRGDGQSFEGSIFENTGDALLAVSEMRRRIREQGLDLGSAIDLVVGRTHQIARCTGVAIGLLQQDRVVYPARAGIAATMAGLHFQANLFRSCLRTGETLQLPDAQKHPRVGATCRREGIGSLIIVPIFRNREVAGAVELLFNEMRSFSTGDVMDLELIAGVVSDALNVAAQIELKPAEGGESRTKSIPEKAVEPQLRHTLNKKAGLVGGLLHPFRATTDEETSLKKSDNSESMMLGLLASKLADAPTPLLLTLKRAWTRRVRAM